MRFKKNDFEQGFLTKKSLMRFRKTGKLETYDVPPNWRIDAIDYIRDDGSQYGRQYIYRDGKVIGEFDTVYLDGYYYSFSLLKLY